MTQQRVPAAHLGPTSPRTGARRSPQRAPVMKRVALFLPEDLPLEEWRRIGDNIAVLADSSTWWLGDWLVYGQRRYPDRYRRAVAETSLDHQTLRNYAWVARRFPPPRRRPALSFQHHAEVAALPERDQDGWLDRAQQSRWSRNTLRRELRAARGGPDTEPAVPVVRLLVRIDATQKDRWQEAADRTERDLVGWMIRVLDDAATSPR